MTFPNSGACEVDALENRVLAVAVDPHLASALNRYRASPLRIEIDEVAMEPTSQANLTALAGKIQRSLDDLGGARQSKWLKGASGKTVGCASSGTPGPGGTTNRPTQ